MSALRESSSRPMLSDSVLSVSGIAQDDSEVPGSERGIMAGVVAGDGTGVVDADAV